MKISILIILALISKITIADEINKDAYIFQKVSTSEIIMKRNIDELMSPASLSKLPLTHLTLKDLWSRASFFILKEQKYFTPER